MVQGGHTLYVGGIDFHVSEDDLQRAFGKYGVITKVSLIRDHTTGQSRGFAYVVFEDAQRATEAKNGMKGTEFNGKPVKIEYSKTEYNMNAPDTPAIPNPRGRGRGLLSGPPRGQPPMNSGGRGLLGAPPGRGSFPGRMMRGRGRGPFRGGSFATGDMHAMEELQVDEEEDFQDSRRVVMGRPPLRRGGPRRGRGMEPFRGGGPHGEGRRLPPKRNFEDEMEEYGDEENFAEDIDMTQVDFGAPPRGAKMPRRDGPPGARGRRLGGRGGPPGERGGPLGGRGGPPHREGPVFGRGGRGMSRGAPPGRGSMNSRNDGLMMRPTRPLLGDGILGPAPGSLPNNQGPLQRDSSIKLDPGRNLGSDVERSTSKSSPLPPKEGNKAASKDIPVSESATGKSSQPIGDEVSKSDDKGKGEPSPGGKENSDLQSKGTAPQDGTKEKLAAVGGPTSSTSEDKNETLANKDVSSKQKEKQPNQGVLSKGEKESDNKGSKDQPKTSSATLATNTTGNLPYRGRDRSPRQENKPPLGNRYSKTRGQDVVPSRGDSFGRSDRGDRGPRQRSDDRLRDRNDRERSAEGRSRGRYPPGRSSDGRTTGRDSGRDGSPWRDGGRGPGRSGGREDSRRTDDRPSRYDIPPRRDESYRGSSSRGSSRGRGPSSRGDEDRDLRRRGDIDRNEFGGRKPDGSFEPESIDQSRRRDRYGRYGEDDASRGRGFPIRGDPGRAAGDDTGRGLGEPGRGIGPGRGMRREAVRGAPGEIEMRAREGVGRGTGGESGRGILGEFGRGITGDVGRGMRGELGRGTGGEPLRGMVGTEGGRLDRGPPKRQLSPRPGAALDDRMYRGDVWDQEDSKFKRTSDNYDNYRSHELEGHSAKQMTADNYYGQGHGTYANEGPRGSEFYNREFPPSRAPPGKERPPGPPLRERPMEVREYYGTGRESDGAGMQDTRYAPQSRDEYPDRGGIKAPMGRAEYDMREPLDQPRRQEYGRGDEYYSAREEQDPMRSKESLTRSRVDTAQFTDYDNNYYSYQGASNEDHRKTIDAKSSYSYDDYYMRSDRPVDTVPRKEGYPAMKDSGAYSYSSDRNTTGGRDYYQYSSAQRQTSEVTYPRDKSYVQYPTKEQRSKEFDYAPAYSNQESYAGQGSRGSVEQEGTLGTRYAQGEMSMYGGYPSDDRFDSRKGYGVSSSFPSARGESFAGDRGLPDSRDPALTYGQDKAATGRSPMSRGMETVPDRRWEYSSSLRTVPGQRQPHDVAVNVEKSDTGLNRYDRSSNITRTIADISSGYNEFTGAGGSRDTMRANQGQASTSGRDPYTPRQTQVAISGLGLTADAYGGQTSLGVEGGSLKPLRSYAPPVSDVSTTKDRDFLLGSKDQSVGSSLYAAIKKTQTSSSKDSSLSSDSWLNYDYAAALRGISAINRSSTYAQSATNLGGSLYSKPNEKRTQVAGSALNVTDSRSYLLDKSGYGKSELERGGGYVGYDRPSSFPSGGPSQYGDLTANKQYGGTTPQSTSDVYGKSTPKATTTQADSNQVAKSKYLFPSAAAVSSSYGLL